MYADVEKHRKMATTKAMTKRNNNFEVHSIRLARKLLVNQFIAITQNARCMVMILLYLI